MLYKRLEINEKPLPTPVSGEEEQDFISRCVAFAMDEGMDQDQAVAACYDIWNNKTITHNNMKKLEIPEFNNKNDLIKFVVENQKTLIAQKKSEPKHADSIVLVPVISNEKGEAYKANNLIQDPPDLLKVRAVINTTNILDSHEDVHFPGLWDKSLNQNKFIMHIQEHELRKFSHIISEGPDLKAFVEFVDWKELGFSFPGKTQALIFDSNVRKSRNPFMWTQYSKGYVKNHSVGMQYVRVALAVNDEDYGANFEVWNKYIDEVVNRSDAEDLGYFWAVTEAKVIEGSAVPRGSNYATPTLDNNMKFAPSKDTQTPELSAPQESIRKSFSELLQTKKLFENG